MGSKGAPADRAEGPVPPAGLLGRGEKSRVAKKSESCCSQEKPDGGICHLNS